MKYMLLTYGKGMFEKRKEHAKACRSSMSLRQYTKKGNFATDPLYPPPILAAFYLAELIEKFKINANPEPERNTIPSHPSPTNMIMYVDDGKIYMSSDSLETNTIILKTTYLEVESWLKSAGLSSDLTKRELMHYSRQPKYDCCPHLTIVDHNGITRTIIPERTVKWLGVHFDRKL